MKATTLALSGALLVLGGCGAFDMGLPNVGGSSPPRPIRLSPRYTPKPVAVQGTTLSVVDIDERIFDAADDLALDGPDVVAVYGIRSAGEVARLLDELWRRDLAYDEAARGDGEIAFLVRSDAGLEVVGAATGSYLFGEGDWAYVDLVRSDTELRVVATALDTLEVHERLLQVEELLHETACVDAPMVLTANLGQESRDGAPDVRRVLAETGFEEVTDDAPSDVAQGFACWLRQGGRD